MPHVSGAEEACVLGAAFDSDKGGRGRRVGVEHSLILYTLSCLDTH